MDTMNGLDAAVTSAKRTWYGLAGGRVSASGVAWNVVLIYLYSMDVVLSNAPIVFWETPGPLDVCEMMVCVTWHVCARK